MLKPDVGERIADRYLLEREIARGGMGAVWAGRDEKLKRMVAIKLLKPTWDANSDARMRFEREATAVAQLQCPNVVQIFDYGVEREVPFIVMELLDGEDLHHRLKRVRRMSIDDLARIMWQTAKALGVAHGAGIVHRDLKPANIFLVKMGEEEIAKVLDFGVAKATTEDEDEDEEHQTRDGTILGTPQFMSPEQARGLIGSIDHRSDLWSLGVIAYRALTGTLPFKGKTAADAIISIITAPFRKATEVAPDLPVELDDFFNKALSKDPARRFSSAREMALAFGNITPMSVPSLRMPEPALREIARKAEEAEVEARRPSALPIPRKGRPLPPRQRPPALPRPGYPSSPDLGAAGSDRLSSSGIDFSADSSPSSSGRVAIPDIGALSARAKEAAAEAAHGEPSASTSGLDLAWPTPGSGSASGTGRASAEFGVLTPASAPNSLDMALVTPPPDTMPSQFETNGSQASLRGVLLESDPVAARRRARSRTIAIVAAFAVVGVVGVVFGAGVFGALPEAVDAAQATPASQTAAAAADEEPATESPPTDHEPAASDDGDSEETADEPDEEAGDTAPEASASAATPAVKIPSRPRPRPVVKPKPTAAPPITAAPPPKPKTSDPFAERL